MKKIVFSLAFFALLSAPAAFAQTQPQTAPANQNVFDLTQYGVRIQPDARLIVVMAALDAAGFDAKQNNSVFRQQLRDDLKNLDPDLRRRLREFFERNNRNSANASPSDQAARYVSLAYALSPAPELASPQRSTDLPGGLLEVLDFAPLVREFYRSSGIAEKMPEYLRKSQAYGDTQLRQPTAAMIRDLTLHLNTRPQTVYFERVKVTTENAKGKKQTSYNERERERRFFVVPDLLGMPRAVKFRVIGDDYYAVVGEDVEPQTSSELRRAYLQFLIDALVFKNAKEIAVQREAIRGLLDEQRAKTGMSISPDIYLTVARSFVVAADARQTESQKIKTATDAARQKIDRVKTEAEKLAVSGELKKTREAAERETFAELSEAYENGAVLAFYFADKLRGLESSGFDVAGSFADLIVSFDAAKEKVRLAGEATKRAQALAELKKRRETTAGGEIVEIDAAKIRNDKLVAALNEVEQILAVKDYEKAETRLTELLGEFKGEPRIHFALGRTASLSAVGAFDENLLTDRLKKAEARYRMALSFADADTAPGLLAQIHVSLGRVLEFFDRTAEALKEFDAAIAIGQNANSNAFREATEGRKRLTAK